MPTDAKAGLFLGVIATIAIAVLFFRKEDDPSHSVNTSIPEQIRIRSAESKAPITNLSAKSNTKDNSLPIIPMGSNSESRNNTATRVSNKSTMNDFSTEYSPTGLISSPAMLPSPFPPTKKESNRKRTESALNAD